MEVWGIQRMPHRHSACPRHALNIALLLQLLSLRLHACLTARVVCHVWTCTHDVYICCLQAVAKSFGFAVPPRVNLNIESKAAHGRKAAKVKQAGADYRRMKTGHSFSASNPYGKRKESDMRQFVRM